MTDITLQGLAAFAGTPTQMAQNFYAPEMAGAQLAGQNLSNQANSIINQYRPQLLNNQMTQGQLANQATQLGMPYVAPQAKANVALANAQAYNQSAQGGLAGAQTRLAGASSLAQIIAAAKNNPYMQQQLVQQYGWIIDANGNLTPPPGSPLNPSGTLNPTGVPNAQNPQSGQPGMYNSSTNAGVAGVATPGATNAQQLPQAGSYNGFNPAQLSGNDGTFSQLGGNPNQISGGIDPSQLSGVTPSMQDPSQGSSPYALGGNAINSQGAPIMPVGGQPLQAASTVPGMGSTIQQAQNPYVNLSPGQVKDLGTAYMQNKAAPNDLQAKYNNWQSAMQAFGAMENSIKTTPDLKEYLGPAGNLRYEAQLHTPGLLPRDQAFYAVNKIQGLTDDFGKQAYKYFLGSRSNSGAHAEIDQINGWMGPTSDVGSYLNNVSSMKQLLLSEGSQLATQMGRQEDFKNFTGYPVTTDFSAPPLPPAATDPDKIAYWKTLTPEMQAKVKATYPQEIAQQ